MLKILGRATSTNVQKVLWFCDEEGLAYEHDNDIGGAYGRNDTPEYLAMNPNGRVPVVIDGDFVMWESNSIVRCLARKRKSAFYPDRTSVVSGKGVSVRVDLGGCRIIKKKTK